MCITSAPAKLSNTRILAMKMPNENHLLAYSNKAQNLSGKPNAMILPIPGKTSKELFYDTTEYNKFLKDIEKAITPITKSRSKTLSYSASSIVGSPVQDFNVGMYRVLLSEDLFAIQNVLNQLPEDERPSISKELYEFFAQKYYGWSFVVCCFSGTKEMESQPIMLEYTPTYPEYLYFPGMDGHDGSAPDLNKQVSVDHCLVTESTIDAHGKYKPDIKFSQETPEFLKKHYNGRFYKGSQQNGDWYLDTRVVQTYQHPLELIRSISHPSLSTENA